MLLKILGVVVALGFALLILGISVFRVSSPKYAFYQDPNPASPQGFETDVGYFFPSPGILPDNLLWNFKVVRDKVWLAATPNSSRKFTLLLLFADKRVVMSEELAKMGKSELAVVTAQKAEEYLKEAYLQAEEVEKVKGDESTELFETLAKASLRHRESIEYVKSISPEDGGPFLVKVLNGPKEVYQKCIQKLIQKGKTTPKSLQEN